MSSNNFFSFSNITESQKKFLIVLIIVLLPLVCFSNSLLGEFVYDDFITVKDNPSIKNLSDIPKLFLQTYWGQNSTQGLYRPLTLVTFALNFAISRDDPYGYHLVSIFIHIVNSLLIYWLTNSYFKSRQIALLCCLFFAIHPVHSEAVAAIYARPEILATMFMLIAWVGYIKSTNNKLWYALSLVSYFLSLLCKESGIVFIGALLLVQVCTESSWLAKFKPTAKLLGYILITIPYLGIRLYVTKALGAPKGGQFLGSESFLTRVYTMSLGYMQYFRMLIWPDKLYTEYTYEVIPKITNINLAVGLSLLVITSLVIVGIWQINKKPALAYGVLFFFVTTSIVSNIFIPTGILIAERAIYLPAASICLVVALILYQLDKIGWQKLSLSLAIILLALGTVRTYYRNFDFQNNSSLFGSLLNLTKNPVKLTYATAVSYEEKGQFLEAEKYYLEVLKIAPNYLQVHTSLANLYAKQGLFDKALPLLTRATQLAPTYADAYVPLARIYIQQKDYLNAVKAFQTAVNLIIPNAKLQHELALALFYAGEVEKAELEMRKTIELDPNFAEPKVNLARILQKQNKVDQAQVYLDNALAIDPNDADAYTVYGVGLKMKGSFCQAKDYLLKALSINPQLPETHYQLGLVYSELHFYNEARREFETHLRLNPSNSEARKTLLELNKKALNPQPMVNCPS